jgi:hypothetical protein
MRPGSPDRIAYYRERAEQGLPLFDEAPAGIPLLPRHVTCLPKPEPKPEPKEPEKMNIDQAIEALTSDDAEQKINDKIERLETELAKLKKLRRMYVVSEPKPGGSRKEVDPKLEALVVKAVGKMPKTPRQIADEIGIHYMSVGKVVAKSTKVKKVGGVVTLVEL